MASGRGRGYGGQPSAGSNSSNWRTRGYTRPDDASRNSVAPLTSTSKHDAPRSPAPGSTSSARPAHTNEPSSSSIWAALFQSSPVLPAALGRDGMRKRDARASLGAALNPMQLLASPSRGLDAVLVNEDGKRMSLMDVSTQDQLQDYVRDTIKAHGARHPSSWTEQDICDPIRLANTLTDNEPISSAAGDSLEQIALLLRKLREAYTASRREYLTPKSNGLSTLDGRMMSTYVLSVLVALSVWNVPLLQSSLDTLLQLLLPALDEKPPPLPITDTDVDQLQINVRQLWGFTHPLEHTVVPLASPAALADWAASLKVLLSSVSLVTVSSGAVGRHAQVSRSEQIQELAQWKTMLKHTEWLSSIEPIARAIRTGNARALVVHSGSAPIRTSLAHASLLQHAVAPLQTRAWTVLQRAYISVPLPRRLCGHDARDASWIDETLLMAPRTGPGTGPLPTTLRSSLPRHLAAWDDHYRLSILRVGNATHLGTESWVRSDEDLTDPVVLSLRIR